MIGHTINCNQFLSLIPNNARDVLVEFFFELGFDKRLSVAYSKYGLDVIWEKVFAIRSTFRS